MESAIVFFEVVAAWSGEPLLSLRMVFAMCGNVPWQTSAEEERRESGREKLGLAKGDEKVCEGNVGREKESGELQMGASGTCERVGQSGGELCREKECISSL